MQLPTVQCKIYLVINFGNFVFFTYPKIFLQNSIKCGIIMAANNMRILFSVKLLFARFVALANFALQDKSKQINH